MSDNQDIDKNEAKKSATDILNSFRKSKAIFNEFADSYQTTYLINGHPVSHWKEFFKIDIPEDSNTSNLQMIAKKLGTLYQEASVYKRDAESQWYILKSRSSVSHRIATAQIISQYRESNLKIPSKDLLNALAEERIQDELQTAMHAEIAVAFWKNILDDLKYQKSLLENQTTNLAVESKAIQNERYIDSLNQRNNK